MSIYDTKTLRLHLERKGRYCYLMLTRFDGEDHLLADEGWRSTYIHYSIISRNVGTQDAATGDAFSFVRENEWLQGTLVEVFVKDLEMGRIDWDDFEDEELLTEDDVLELSGKPGVVLGGDD